MANADGPASVSATLTMKWLAAARPITFERNAIGRISAPYSHVVELSMPSGELLSVSISGGPAVRLTISDHKEIDSQDCETLADRVVRVLEFQLHDSGVDLDKYNARESSQDHRSSAPCVCKEPSRDRIGHKRHSAVDARKDQDRFGRNTEALVEDGLVVLYHIHTRKTCHSLDRNGSQSPVTEEPEDVLIRLQLAFHLILNLGMHHRKLLLSLSRVKISTYCDELYPRLLDLSVAHKLTRRIRHEELQTQKEDNAPRYLPKS